MQHLNDEELIAHHYRDADASDHLQACSECNEQYQTLRRVLTLVDTLPVPERDPGYSERVWNRVRWRLERRRERRWRWMASVAAILAIAFVTAQWWRTQPAAGGRQTAEIANRQPATINNPTTQQPTNNVLVFVVTDHLDAAERMLAEVANADPKKRLEIGVEQRRAEDLVTANRIYRQTATQRGDARIAALLSDIEPILVELSHAGKELSPEELSSMQKRIDSKNLLFKVRVMSRSEEPVPVSRVNSL